MTVKSTESIAIHPNPELLRSFTVYGTGIDFFSQEQEKLKSPGVVPKKGRLRNTAYAESERMNLKTDDPLSESP